MTDSTGHHFMQATKYDYLEPSPQSQNHPQPPLELPVPDDAPRIDLPAPDTLELAPVNLREVITDRTTIRNYTGKLMSQAELSHLLWCTQGVKETRDTYATLRTVPSAGARHAFETYLLINDVEGLEPGLYRYVALEHKLIAFELGEDLAERVTAACLHQEMVARSAVTFIWGAVVERMTWRYVERGYRYLHLDAGHVCQNLYLAAQVIDCGVCAIGAFNDDAINELLKMDGETQFVIYIATVGKRKV
ncbi:MAG: SagB/ThcOx family dehydrogenase [Anaerolineae bacterium]|nr:SagB/ThcOx family dehydrogenase [Anaerolineae bacterium]